MFYEDIWIIINKLSLLPLLIWSSALCRCYISHSLGDKILSQRAIKPKHTKQRTETCTICSVISISLYFRIIECPSLASLQGEDRHLDWIKQFKNQVPKVEDSKNHTFRLIILQKQNYITNRNIYPAKVRYCNTTIYD